jgi:hypothetical protein
VVTAIDNYATNHRVRGIERRALAVDRCHPVMRVSIGEHDHAAAVHLDIQNRVLDIVTK